ncbi:VOC family protein [Niveispirillum fermenti]|uniref:VOC family protein n=1 Tax=Niveispirillum fermenti TaxID=1233113 RepID=UPI003A86F2B1
MIRGIHHIALNTPNFDRMLVFYRDVLGFVPAIDQVRWADAELADRAVGLKGSAARTVMLRAGNCYLELFEYSAPAARSGEPLRPCDHGYTHFCLDVTDIQAEYARLSSAGMRFAHEEPCDFGNLRAVYGKDPDGNIVEIQETDPDHPFALERLAPAAG